MDDERHLPVQKLKQQNTLNGYGVDIIDGNKMISKLSNSKSG